MTTTAKGAAAAGVTVHAGTATAQERHRRPATLSLPLAMWREFAERRQGEVRLLAEAVDVS